MKHEPIHIHCPACGSTDVRPVLEALDHTVSHASFTVVQCNACTLRFTFPVPDAEHIGEYYQSDEYISHSDTRKGIINKLYHVARSLTLRQKKRWVEKNTGFTTGSILDIGCGTGAFLHVMKNSGWKVTGLEPDETARENARKLYQLSPLPSEELFQLPDDSFQAITLWHVLEHVHDLHNYLDQIYRILHPQGRLFVAIPNYESLDAGIYKSSWAAYDVPRHLYHFSPQAFIRLTAQHRFTLVKKVAMPFDAFYISMLSEKYLHGKTNYFKATKNGLSSWLHAQRNAAQASAILYILKG